MKASYNWLSELVPAVARTSLAPAKLAEVLTGAGFEVEGIDEYGAATTSCLVVTVVAREPHPTKSGLRLVTVDRGPSGTQRIVCGAPNVPEPGHQVVLAPLGAYLPALGVTLAPREIAGVVSEGMLCSEKELGLGDSSDGILVLAPNSAPPGTPFADAVREAHDFIFEIGLTPNRPDGLGHLGLARELSALLEVPFEVPAISEAAAAETTFDALGTTVTITDDERCPHYGAGASLDVTVGPSPLAVRFRLQALGVRSISNVVDVTNLVMLEFGHPMHAFDLDKVTSGITVRRAAEGELLKTLDGVDRKLVHDDLVIADGNGPVALAGVMGGGNSEISTETKRVFLEVAYFDPRGVRRTGRRHGLHTESSHRFERGVDWSDTGRALARAQELLGTLAGGKTAAGNRIVVAKELTRPTVRLTAAFMNRLLGIVVPWSEAHTILERLGLKPAGTTSTDGEATFEIPAHRPDLTREADLVEEVIRVRGIDTIPAILPRVAPTLDFGGREQFLTTVRRAAVNLGLSEAILYALTSPAVLEKAKAEPASVHLQNPLSEYQSVLRTALLPGLLEALANARRHGERSGTLFAATPTFHAQEGAEAGGKALPAEKLTFVAVLAGNRPAWLTKAESWDVWDAKYLAEALVRALVGATPTVTSNKEIATIHPRGGATLAVDGVAVGHFGPLHPDLVESFEVGAGTQVVHLDLDALRGLPKKSFVYQAIPRFPASPRDLALVVHDDVDAGAVSAEIASAAAPLGRRVELFDKFVGGSIPADHRSLAFRVVYQADDRTLTDKEVDDVHGRVVSAVEARFSAKQRG